MVEVEAANPEAFALALAVDDHTALCSVEMTCTAAVQAVARSTAGVLVGTSGYTLMDCTHCRLQLVSCQQNWEDTVPIFGRSDTDSCQGLSSDYSHTLSELVLEVVDGLVLYHQQSHQGEMQEYERLLNWVC